MIKNGSLILISFFTLILNKITAQPCREVIGYYPAWQWYDRGQLVNPKSIRYDRYTIINYAFFKPKTDGSLEGTDAWADENLLEGQINYQTTPQSHYPNTSLVDLAHAAGVKVLISIGGWSLSDNFSTIASNEETRQKFADECRRLIEKYQIDGVDIDWEYPGYAEHKGTSADKENFTKLITNIRNALDDLTLKTNKTYLLTAAFGASAGNMDNIDWAAITPKLHSINLMTYDFNGAWNKKTEHNAPLYAPDSNGCDAAVTRLMTTYNVSADKICLGIAFYGRSTKTVGAATHLARTSGKADVKVFKMDNGAPMFYNILHKKHLFKTHWDSVAQVPYLTGNKNLRTFLSYDDERSVALKAQYIVDKKLRGTILWDLTGDYVETAKGSGIVAATPLADTILHVFCQTIKIVPTETVVQDTVSTDSKPSIIPYEVPPMDSNRLKSLEETAKVDAAIVRENVEENANTIMINTDNQPETAPIIEPVTDVEFMDFSLQTIPNELKVSFDLKQKRLVQINIRDLEGKILRGKDFGFLKQETTVLDISDMLHDLVADAYYIELVLPRLDTLPLEKVMRKWVKK